MGLMNQTPT